MTPQPDNDSTSVASTPDTTILGTGILIWPRHERSSDRYGTVTLDRAPDGEGTDPVPFDAAPVGAHGRLVAIILATRRSPHCGNLARGLVPTTPQVGDQIPLGTGTLFVNASPQDRTEIGLAPDDERARDWLDPHALYRCHSQTVRLEFHPDPASASGRTPACPGCTQGHQVPGRNGAIITVHDVDGTQLPPPGHDDTP